MEQLIEKINKLRQMAATKQQGAITEQHYFAGALDAYSVVLDVINGKLDPTMLVPAPQSEEVPEVIEANT